MDGPFFLTRNGRFLLSGQNRLGPSLDIATGSWDTQDRLFGDDLFEASPISDAEAVKALASAAQNMQYPHADRGSMAPIGNAIRIAADAHEGQRDRGGELYIFHPLRLMTRMSTPDQQVIAVLHDVVEDSNWKIENLREEGFSDVVLGAVALLTKPDNCPYEEYVQRIKSSPLAARVKIADLEDNLNITRLPSLNSKDLERIQKYHAAWVLLSGK